MTTLKKNKLKHLNRYSWSIIIVFIGVLFAMYYQTANISCVAIIQTLPLIMIAIYYSEKLAPLISQPEHNLKKSQLLTRDVFILSISFLFACLLSLIFSYNNSDTKALWPLIIYFMTLYGLLFALFFSAVALLIKSHKTYTIIIALIIIVLVSIGQFLPSYMFMPMLGNIEPFYAITFSLLILHCLVSIGYKMYYLTKQ